MMKTINRVQLLGGLGGDPEQKIYNDVSVVRFFLATGYKKQNKEITDWHPITVFNKLGEVCMRRLKKGEKF